MEQRTEEWFRARLGKVTASRVADVVAKTKSGYSASRANYMAELVCERLTGRKTESFSNAAMEWGVEQESNARAAYEALTGVMVEECGFIPHARIMGAGASPDGRIPQDAGLVEIKCPNTATALDLILTEKIPAKWVTQMQFQMACTAALWCDFVCFDPRLPEHLQLFIKRVERDDEEIERLESEVEIFLAEVEETVEKLKEKNRA